MKPSLYLIAGACAALIAGQAAAAPVDTGKIAAAIKALEAQWSASIASRDPVKFASFYSDDAVFMNPGAPIAHGRAEIVAAMKQAFSDPNFSLVFAPDRVEVSAAGDLAATQGRCTESESDPATHAKITQACAYATVYRPQADGSWRAVIDIDTPSK
jgi:uncharacterized protein (TIGR02246 family)